MAWPRLVEASGQPKQVKVSNRLGPWNLLPGSFGSPDLLDPSGLGVCGHAPVAHGPHCSTASRARYHTHLRCAVGTPRVRKAPQAHMAFYYSKHKQRDTSLAMWIPHPISHTPVLLGLLLPLLPMADQARLQRHPIKPARRVRQQHPRRVKLGHAAQIEDQDARRLDDRVQTVSVVHDQERACARMGKEKTYAIVRMVTSSKRGPRMISWIARSVSKSTADVAVSVRQHPCAGRDEHANVPSSSTSTLDCRSVRVSDGLSWNPRQRSPFSTTHAQNTTAASVQPTTTNRLLALVHRDPLEGSPHTSSNGPNNTKGRQTKSPMRTREIRTCSSAAQISASGYSPTGSMFSRSVPSNMSGLCGTIEITVRTVGNGK